MAKDKNTIDLGYDINIDVKGLKKLSADLSKLKDGNKALSTLASLIGGLEAIAEEIKYLAKSGLEGDAKRIASQVKQISDSIAGLKIPGISKPASRPAGKVSIEREKSAILSSSDKYIKTPQWDIEKEARKRATTVTTAEVQASIKQQEEKLRLAQEELTVARELVKLDKTHADVQRDKSKLNVAQEKVRLSQTELDTQKAVLNVLTEQERLQKAGQLKEIADQIRLAGSATGISVSGSVTEMKARKTALEQEIKANGVLINQAKEKAMLASKDDFEAEKQKYAVLVSETRAKQAELEALKQAIPVKQRESLLIEKDNQELKHKQKLTETVHDTNKKNNLTVQEELASIKQVNKQLASMPENLREAAAERFARALQDAGINAVRVGNHLERAGQATEKTQSGLLVLCKRLKDATLQMFSIQKLAQRISFVITAVLSYRVFDYVKDGIRSIITTNAEFQDEMSKTYAIMDDRSEEAKQKLSEQVRELAKQYRISMQEAADGIYEVISAQVSLKDSAQVLEAAMKLAVGGFSDLKDATLSLVQLLNAYDLEMTKAAHVADVVFETTRLGILTTQQYATQMSKLGSTASMFGISIEEISAAISVMTRNGVQVEQAFTALNQLLLTIANPTEEAKRTMEAYGVTLDLNTVRAKGLVNALLGLGGILQSEEAMTNLVKSRTSAKAMFSLVQNAEEYASDLIKMYDSEGAASEAANERLNTTASLLQQLKVFVRDITINLGSSLDPVLRKMLGFLNSSLKLANDGFWVLKAVVNGLILQLAVTKTPKLLINMSTLLFKMIPSVKSLIAGFKTLIGIMQNPVKDMKKVIDNLKTGLEAAKSSGVSAGKAISAAWSGATSAISGLIFLVTQLISWLGQLAQKAREARIDEALGSKDIQAKIEKINNQISIMDSKLSSMEGIYKMTKQADELYKSLGNDVKQVENFNKFQEKTVEAVNRVLGTQLKASEVRGKLGELEEKMQLRYIELQKEKIRLTVELQRQEQIATTSALLKEMSKSRPGSAFTRSYMSRITLKNVLTEYGFADIWWLGIQNKLLELSKDMRGITEKSTQSTIQAMKNRIDDIEKDIESGAERWAKDKIISGKANELLTQLVGWELFLQQVEENQLTLATGLESLKVPDLSDEIKDITAGAGELQDKLLEVLDKYTDLFRGFGVEFDSSSAEKLRDVKEAVDKIRKDVNNLPISQDLIDTLNTFGEFVVQFGEVNELLRRKGRSFEGIVSNIADMRKLLDSISQTELSGYIEMLRATGVPELRALADNLSDNVSELIENLTAQVDAYLDKEVMNLIRKAPTEEAKVELSRRVLELNAVLYEKVLGASLDELEKIVEDEKTPESSKVYIKHAIEVKRKNIADGLRAMAGEYSGLLTDLEDNIKDIETVMKYMRDRILKMGGSVDLVEDLFKAYAAGDTEAIDKFFKSVQAGKYPTIKIPVTQTPEEFQKNIEAVFKEPLEGAGYFQMTPEQQRQLIYQLLGIEPGKVPFADLFKKSEVTGKPAVSKGELADFAKSQLGLDEAMTLEQAFNLAQSKIIDVSSEAWRLYWDNRVKMAEEARDRLLKNEEEYMQKMKDQNDIMLANENISADQRAALARRLEEQQRKSEERKQEIQEQYDKKASKLKQQQAEWELGISFAKSVAEIWARELSSKGALGFASAATLTSFLTAMFAAQMVLIRKQSFAAGGYTGKGIGAVDETGQRPAGIVHAGEIVFPKDVVDRNYSELMGMYTALKAGEDFGSFVMKHLLRGSRPAFVARSGSGLYANGGYVGRASLAVSEPVVVDINLSGARVIDDIELHKRVEIGGRKRRYIVNG